MAIAIVSYSYVEPGGSPPRMRIRNVSAEIGVYLEEHVDALVRSVGTGSISPAFFRSQPGRTRFDQLSSGTTAAFLASSKELADRLIQRMDQRAKRGFFVTLRGSGSTPFGAALKLDVHEEAAAALYLDKKGDPTLEAVKDLLDIPGALQKGAVIPDQRPNSEVIVGDKLAVTSLYFLEAIDVEQHASPGPATVDLLRVVREVAPQRTEAVAQAMESEARQSVGQFFERHPDVLTESESAEVMQRALIRRRPIGEIDPEAYTIREEIDADGITIRARATTIRSKLRVVQRPGGYRIEIDVDEEPRRRFV
jgi:hypothetical protein